MNNPLIIPFDIPVEPAENLQTTGVKCLLEMGALRYIRSEHQELVRMIYGAVRDELWNTAQMTIEDLKKDQRENAFSVEFTALFHLEKGAAPVYQMNVMIRATDEHTLTYEMKGKVLTDFRTNRIGLCVLLPIESCQDRAGKVTSPDGKTHHMSFPTMISPHQPVKNIASIEWHTANETRVQLRFEGDVFEMEDQRNWMDNSYKIYSRPLELPFPYPVKKGESHHQKVILHITQGPSSEPKKNSQSKSQAPEHKAFPRTGYYISDLQTFYEFMGFLSNKYTVIHIRLELNTACRGTRYGGDWRDRLMEGIRMAWRMHSGLELITLFTSAYEEESQELLEVLKKYADEVKSLLPLHKDHEVTPGFLSDHLYDRYKNALPGLKIGYGTDLYFAELNRNRPGPQPYDFVSFSLNPQVHTTDTRTLLENLQAIPDIIATVRSFTDKPIYVSPLTIQRRAEKAPTGFLKEDPDERAHTHFAIGWYLLALYYLQGAEQVTLSIPPPDLKDTGDSNSPFHLLFQALSTKPKSLVMDRSEEGWILEIKSEDGCEYTISLDPTE